EPGHGFQVVVHDIGRAFVQDTQRAVQPAAKVGHQHFDPGAGRKLTHLAYAFHEMRGAAIAQVVSIDGCDDHIGKLHGGNASGQVDRLVCIQRVGPTVTDITERASAGAFVAHDHEGG